ncbi:hypothetical protein DPMN_150686 [Dreissena polymorpha]|uniref:Uncharacterized protein n=1 Tax=Dreissena polymorpha TaxID=45954 RepID=A0A9D4FI55_DREPO|nr:hypothetical protein DPMN_150686 [Dreissena polymorpha]
MFTDSASSVSFAYQVYIVQNSADPSQYDGPLQSLPSIEYIRLQSVTCSCTWLRSLFSTLQKLDHEVECRLMECNITSYVEGAVSGPDIKTGAILKFLKNKSNMLEINKESLSLWKAVHGMNIKNLRLQGVNVNHTESMLQSLSSFTQLETLSVHMCHNSPNLWKGIRGLNIKSLSLSGLLGLMDVNQVESLSQSLCSFKHLETLSIGMCNNSPNLWKGVRGLNIKSLSLNGLSGLMDVNHVELLSQSLCSFKHLETLSITTFNESPDLWKGLRCLNIKSLNLTGCLRRMNLNNVELLLQSLSSLKQLETLSIEMYDDKPGLWEGQGLQGLNIKSLSLSSWWGTMKGNSAELLLHSSLLNEAYNNNSNIWKGLHGLNIKNLSLSGDLVWLHVYHIESMLQSLSSFSHLETLSIDLHYANSELWQVLRDLNITNDQCGWLTVNPGGSLSHSLSSLKQLETLTIYVRTFFDIQLPQSLKYLNVYCFALLPSELRKLVDTLSARTCTIEIKLEFGCASFKDFRVKPIPPAEYISVQQELETLKNVAVKRFLLLNRICETEIYDDLDVLESAWSACGICCVDAHNHNHAHDNVAEKAYKCFMRNYDNEIINRISMRFLINPA